MKEEEAARVLGAAVKGVAVRAEAAKVRARSAVVVRVEAAQDWVATVAGLRGAAEQVGEEKVAGSGAGDKVVVQMGGGREGEVAEAEAKVAVSMVEVRMVVGSVKALEVAG